MHAKFIAEYSSSSISYTLFCRLKPFWVVAPKESDRQTCLCKIHENSQLSVSKLKSLGILHSENLDEVAQTMACDVNNKRCMYGECSSCKDSIFPRNQMDTNAKTTYFQWENVKEDRIIRGESKVVSRVEKQEISSKVGDLINVCITNMERYKRHSYNIIHQFRFYRSLRQTIGENECIIHIDFAENYLCKLNREIQSMHFGASKRQVSIHTGVYYIGPNGRANSFCSNI